MSRLVKHLNHKTNPLFFPNIVCGDIFCDTCTKHSASIPLLDDKTPKRVCDQCYQKLQSQTLSSVFQNNTNSPPRTNSPDYTTNNHETSTTNDAQSKL